MALPKIREQIESRIQDVGDIMTGFLTLSGNPTSDLHAATKQYVDTEIKDANYLPLEGGVMTGEIKIGQGDGYGIQLGASGRINTTSGDLTNCTIVGMNGTGTLIGHSNFSMIIRGSGERPTYNSSALALYNDILSLAPSKTGSGASGTWGISISGNAATATALTSNAGSAGQAIYFTGGKPAAIDWRIGNSGTGEHNCNNVTYNFCGYYRTNGPATTIGASVSDGALYAQAYSTAWVAQIAQDYRDGALFVRGKNNGTWTAWLNILDSNGGIVTGQITKAGTSSSWINGRDKALVRLSSYNAYSAITSMKTTNGSWEMGVYTNDNMWFTYASDANYNSNTNTVTQIQISPAGALIVAANTDYTTYKARNIAANTSALTSGSSSLTNGYIYVQYE